MAWPTNKPDTTKFDDAADSIATSRAELETMSQAVNDIVDFIDTTSIANNYILQYNSTSGKLEFVPNSGGGGGVTNPLTADLDVDNYKIKSTTNQVLIESDAGYPIKLHAPEIHLDVQSGSGTGVPTLEFQTGSGGIGLMQNDNAATSIFMYGSGLFKIAASGEINLNGSSYSLGDTATTGYFLPTTKGTSGQYLKLTSGNVTSFQDLDISNDTSPTLGGDLATGGYAIKGSNGELRLMVDQESPGSKIQIGSTSSFAWFDDTGAELHGSGSLSLNPDDTTSGNSTILIQSGASTQRVYVRGTDGVEINRINIPDAISQSASVGQVLRVSSIGNPGVFNNNDVVNLEFATISGGAGGITDINAGNNITVNEESPGGVTISLADPINNPVDMNENQLKDAVLRGYSEHIVTTLPTSGTITPDVDDGNVATITLSGNITINGFTGFANGDSMTIILRQPSSGGPYTLSSTMKFAGGNKTLSTTANAIDVLSIFYDGTDYIASLSTNFS